MYKKVIGFLMLWLASSAQATVVISPQFEIFNSDSPHTSEYLDFNLDGGVDEFGYQTSCKEFGGFQGKYVTGVGFDAKATQATGGVIFRMPMANYTFTFWTNQKLCSLMPIQVSVVRAANRMARPVLVVGLRVDGNAKIMLATMTGQQVMNNGKPVVLDLWYSGEREDRSISVGDYIRSATGDELRVRSATDGGHWYEYYDLNTFQLIRKQLVFPAQ